MSSPSLWSEYISSLANGNPGKGLATFHARYNLASKFDGILGQGLAEKSLLGYSAILKVGLSYANLEYIEGLNGIKSHPAIDAKDLAVQFRVLYPNGILGMARRMRLNDLLKNRLEELHKNPHSNDVRPVVELLRHALFHGAFTPIGWKLGHTKESLDWLEGLSQVTLRQADQTFSDWFKLQTKN